MQESLIGSGWQAGACWACRCPNAALKVRGAAQRVHLICISLNAWSSLLLDWDIKLMISWQVQRTGNAAD